MSATHTMTEDALTVVLRELLTNALTEGKVSIRWADTPALIAKLQAAGVLVEGIHSDYERKKAIRLSNIVISIDE